MLDAYIYDGLRSPIGRYAGALSGVRPDDLAAEVIAQVVTRNAIKPEEITDIVLGCVNQAGGDRATHARQVAVSVARLVDAAEHDVGDFVVLDAVAPDDLGDDLAREIVGPHARKDACIATDG